VKRSLVFLAAFLAVPLLAQEKVKEPSTEIEFPTVVKFTSEGKEYQASLTGVAVRKKVIFKVYGMAHYMQDAGKMGEADAYAAVLTDGKAKQISLQFVRDVDAASIQSAYRDGFKNSTPAADLPKIQGSIDKLLAYFSTPVKVGDAFTYRWLPGGTIIATVQGQEKPGITDPAFAKSLWAIWFGEDSIVDREDLVTRMIAH
jgi:hypothetical protein